MAFPSTVHDGMLVISTTVHATAITDLSLRFFRVSKRDAWFSRIVDGIAYHPRRTLDCITVLDVLRDAAVARLRPGTLAPAGCDCAVIHPYQQSVSTVAVVDKTAPSAASPDPPANNTAPAAPATNSAPANYTTAAADADDDDPLPGIKTAATARAKRQAALRRWGPCKHRPVQLRVRKAPPCVSGVLDDSYAEVWVMLGHGYELWVDVGSLGWLVSYASDEHNCLSAPPRGGTDGRVEPLPTRSWKRFKAEEPRHPNCESHCPGLVRMFDHHLQRWEFEFVERVAGPAPEDVHLRR